MMSHIRHPREFSSRPQISAHDDLETILDEDQGGVIQRLIRKIGRERALDLAGLFQGTKKSGIDNEYQQYPKHQTNYDPSPL